MQRITYKQLSADALLPLYHLATIREEFIEKYNEPFDVPANRVFSRDGATWLKEEQYARQRFIQIWDEHDQAQGLAVVKSYDADTKTYTLIATKYNTGPEEFAEEVKTSIIDDDNAALDTTYSSEKIEELVSSVSIGYYLLYNKLNERIIGNTEVLTFADTVLDPDELKIGDVIYDTNAIVSRVVAIDRDAGTFTAKTMLSHEEGNSLSGLTYENDYNYSKNDYIIVENKLYRCNQNYATADTDTFAQDLADGKWTCCNIYTTQNPDGGTVYYGTEANFSGEDLLFQPSDIIIVFDNSTDGIVKLKVGPRTGTDVFDNLPYLSADVPDTGCLGSIKNDNPASFPADPNNGNWVLVLDCVNTAAGQAGIAVYSGGTWDIIPIPVAATQFPEPASDGKYYLRTVDVGGTTGYWVEHNKDVNGNDNLIQIKEVNSDDTPTLVPAKGELVYDSFTGNVLLGDGVKDLRNLEPFYASKDGGGGGSGAGSLDGTAIINALGYTPEDAANRSQANGYAPLGADGKVPAGFLPDSSTDGYSKAEVDAKDTALKAELITAINTESATARAAEEALQTQLTNHINETSIHVNQAEKDNWNGKLDSTALAPFNTHISDNSIHVTQADKNKWDGMSRAYFVASVGALPLAGNEIGNLGYVRTSAAGVTPMTCDTYLWDGTSWIKYNAGGGTGGSGGTTALSFSWNDILDKPNVTTLQLEQAVEKMHEHLNKVYLDKISQSATGNFMYNGVEIGVKIRFYEGETDMPVTGESDTLYLVYSDSRVRHFPSLSVWRDGSFQILGRGVQDTAQVIGDMVVLQNEFFGVAANTNVKFAVAENDQYAFTPLEILLLIPGKKSQEVIVSDFDNPEAFDYNPDLIHIDNTSKLTARLAELECEKEDYVGDYYHFYVDVNLEDYRDINYIG